MDRRTAMRSGIVAAVAAVAELAMPVKASQPVRQPGRYYHRFDRPSDQWVPIAFEDIRSGMPIWIEDVPHDPDNLGAGVVFVARGVDESPDGQSFMTSHRIDPATNTWV